MITNRIFLRINKLLNVGTAKFAVECLVLHPVSYPNKGPIIQQYLAEEAIGLAKSLGWSIKQGPFWNESRQQLQEYKQQQIDSEVTEIRDGNYVNVHGIKGTYYKGGIIIDGEQSESEGDLYDEWKNKLWRQSLANKSLIKTKRITQKLFFTRGKADFIGNYIKKQKIKCVFINAELMPGQIRNLRKLFEAKLNNKQSSIKYGHNDDGSQTEFQSEQQTANQTRHKNQFHVKIFDRFSIILQIFAKRAKTKIAKLQIQLNYLNYIKTRLVRSEGSTYSSSYNIFYGDLMKAQEINLQIVSAKQRRAHAAMSGAGESQLEIERRNVKDREAKIRREIDEEKRLRDLALNKKKIRIRGIPFIALVGYTNAGKSAMMNYLSKKEEVESQDLLFQTLTTTTREVILPSGSRALLLDTIGFISNLPHELIESFKTTLEQVESSTLVIHIIDVSNPNYEHQKATVIKVLKELNFQQSFYTDRMVEIYNKVDLLKKQELDALPANSIKVSAIKGTGVRELMELVEYRTNQLLNKGVYVIKYDINEHFDRTRWLRQNANISNELNQQYDYKPSKQFPNGSVSYKLILDGATYGKFQKAFDQSPEKKTQKGMPPKGWNKK